MSTLHSEIQALTEAVGSRDAQLNTLRGVMNKMTAVQEPPTSPGEAEKALAVALAELEEVRRGRDAAAEEARAQIAQLQAKH